jgi:riboflavin transporter FmnP
MNRSIRNLTNSSLCLALCLVLPFLTGQIPEIGGMLCPMHFPVLLCGFLCGGPWGAAVGMVAPLLRHVLFHMPPLITALGMTFELGTYGLVSALLYRRLPKTASGLYVSLLGAMISGRIVWGCAMTVICGIAETTFGWEMFLSGALLSAIPGILLQLVLLPILVIALKRAKIMD